MPNYKTLSEIDSIKETKKYWKIKKHISNFLQNFLTNDILIQKKCLKNKDIFFALNQNKFIHIKCNRLFVNKLESLKSKQKKHCKMT